MEYSAVGAALILSARQVSNGQAFMSAQAKATEPSMEEILASIRRIISDDDPKPGEAEGAADAAAEAPAPAATPAQAPEPEPQPAAAAVEEDVLDLGAEAALIAAPPPEPPKAEPAPTPAAPAAEEPDVAFLEEAPAAAPTPEPVLAPSPPPLPAAAFMPSSSAAPAVDMASLLSDQASSAVTNAFGHLANTVLSNNARTLEDLVKEMLKPMLKAWLDDNLPTMVERLVRSEIERVARGGRN